MNVEDKLFSELDSWLEANPLDPSIEVRVCTKCGEVKSLEEFHKRSSRPGKYASACRTCHSKLTSAWDKRHREVGKIRCKQWYHANKETQLPKLREKRREFPEASRKAAKDWYYQNKDKAMARNKRYEAAKLQAVPGWANDAAIALFYEESQFATEFFGIPFHVDHIVPLRSKIVCGLHWELNLRVIKGEDNLSKSNKYWPDMP